MLFPFSVTVSRPSYSLCFKICGQHFGMRKVKERYFGLTCWQTAGSVHELLQCGKNNSRHDICHGILIDKQSLELSVSCAI